MFGHLDQFVAGAIVGRAGRRARGRRALGDRACRAASGGSGIVVVLAMLALGAYHGSTLGASRGNGFDPLLHPLFGLLVGGGHPAPAHDDAARRGSSTARCARSG